MLLKQLGADLPDEERKRFLSDNCDRMDDVRYTRQFTDDELAGMKDELSEVSIKANDIEEEKKEAVAGYTAELKPLQEKKKELLRNLRAKSDLVNEQCYTFFDQDSGKVGYYNGDGLLVDSRTMRPGERQKTIFEVTRNPDRPDKTGTND